MNGGGDTIIICDIIIKNRKYITYWITNTLGNNTIGSKKLAIIVSGQKKHSTTLLQVNTGEHECRNVTTTYVAVTFWHLCLPVFAWRSAVLCFFDPKQLLRVSCFLWCYYPKCYSIILENAILWCFIVIQYL